MDGMTSLRSARELYEVLFDVQRLTCVVQHGRLAYDADGANQTDDRVDPEETAVDHQRHVLPVFFRLQQSSNVRQHGLSNKF